MKALKYLVLVCLIVFGALCIFAESKNDANTIEQESNMKANNSSSQWRVRRCTRCGGSGYQVATVTVNGRNTATRMLLICPKCNGRGYEGMTKD